MKKTFVLILGLTPLGLLGAGCASTYPAGSVWADLKLPASLTSNAATPTNKVGVATCRSFFGVFATGDASIEAAMKNGNITKVHYADWQVKNIVGVATYRLVVHGE